MQSKLYTVVLDLFHKILIRISDNSNCFYPTTKTFDVVSEDVLIR